MRKRYQPTHLNFNKKKKRRSVPTSALIVYLLIAVTLTNGVSFSRYSTSVSGSDSARVAKWDVKIVGQENGISIDGFNSSVNPSGSYKVTVNNNSEVTAEYTITLRTISPLPAGIKLEMNGETVDTDGISKEYIFPGGSLVPGGNTEHSLTITAELDTLIEDVDQQVTVDVAFTQVD